MNGVSIFGFSSGHFFFAVYLLLMIDEASGSFLGGGILLFPHLVL
jgi:hypothetical protein